MHTSDPKRVAVVFGGRSSEHSVSCWSAVNVSQGLIDAGHEVVYVGIAKDGAYRLLDGVPGGEMPEVSAEAGEDFSPASFKDVDVAFPILHGPNGEDGSLQGLFASLEVPYVGCGVAASAVATDKYLLKEICAATGIPQNPFMLVHGYDLDRDEQAVIREITSRFSFPIFVKPVRQGSSIGISRATTDGELREALALAKTLDRTILVEPALSDFREIECAVLGLDDPLVTRPGEINKTAEAWYDFDTKYLHPASVTYTAQVPDGVVEATSHMAKKLWKAVGMRGLARFDFFYLSDGQILLNEVNTLPGFTAASLYPKLIEAAGMSLPELVDRLVTYALDVAEDGSWPA